MIYPHAARTPPTEALLVNPKRRGHHRPALPGLVLELDGEGTARRLFVALVGLAVVLFVLDAVINYGRLTDIGSIRRLFNMAKEDTLAAWFATVQTLFTGISLALVAWHARCSELGRWRCRGWTVLAVFFLYLAIDDGAGIHERVGTALSKLAERASDEGSNSLASRLLALTPSYEWHLVFGPIFGAMGLFILVFLWRELILPRQRLRLIAALACYVLAVGLDFVEGIEDSYERLALTLPASREALSHFSRTLEEFLELLGTTFFLTTFVRHFVRQVQRVEVQIH